MKWIFAAILSIITVFSSLSQDRRPIHFQHITSAEGLSQGHILSMIKDREGYIWIGTYYGLNRFNGYTFKTFIDNAKDKNAVITKIAYCLYEDKQGYIWVGTVWGLDRYDKKKEIFEHIPVGIEKGGISNGYVHAIAQDKKGDIWIGTDNGGINKIDYQTRKVTYFNATNGRPDKLNSNRINDLIIDRKNRLWAATEGGGLTCMDLNTGKTMTFRKSKNAIPFDNISCLFEDSRGVIWLGNFQGQLTSYDPEKNVFLSHNFISPQYRSYQFRIQNIDQDKEGNLLIATNGLGLVIYHLNTKTSDVYLHQINNPKTILANEAYSLLVDSTGTIFVGTYGRGISYYSLSNRKFPNYLLPTDNSLEGNKNSFTNCVEDSNGHLIIGSYNGFFVYQKKDMTYQHFLPGKTYEENKILTLAVAPDQSIWMGTSNNLHRYDKNFKKLKSYIFFKEKQDHPIYSILFDHRKDLWFATFSNGLIRVKYSDWSNRERSLKYNIYKCIQADSATPSGNQIWDIKEDKFHQLWIATNDGICRYNDKNDRFIRYYITKIPKTISFDQDENLWITTRGDGVYFFNRKNDSIEHFTTRNGLCHNFVFGSIVDPFKNIWFTTEDGLSRFNTRTKTFRNYDIYDGLPNNRFDDCSEKMLSDGSIYLGTAQGFTIFRPENIQDAQNSPNIVLTGLRISNHPYSGADSSVTPLDRIKEIHLYPDQKDVSFEFAALDFAASHRITYEYMLQGFDNSWIRTSAKQRVVRYTNLDKGNYTFFVRATNSDGKWSDKLLHIKLIVHPPFYKTVLFNLAVIFLIITLVFLFFQWRISAQKKQNLKLALLVEDRTLELTEKNKLLNDTAKHLNETNTLLEERQQIIEEQKEELSSQRDELASINSQKDRLFSIIAHDLKNPFNIILGYTDLLISNNHQYDEEKRHTLLNYVRQSSHSAFLLLENLLQWSRNQNNTLIFSPVSLNLRAVLLSALNQISSLAENKNIQILYESDIEKFSIMADENMISTVLRNVLTNAIKFSHKGGTIQIRAVKENNFVWISVIDEGIGMDQKVIDNLFKTDQNNTSTGTEGEKGTGLGLLLCKSFIDIHKGKIRIDSIPEKGTTFTFSIPSVN